MKNSKVLITNIIISIVLSFTFCDNSSDIVTADGRDEPLIQIPGIIEAENYIRGGEGIGYHDTTVGNNGGVYKSDDVDIGDTDDGGYCIGYTDNGEWLKYNVNVMYSGLYDLEVMVARAWYDANSYIHIEYDGQNISGPIFVPNTGGFNIFEPVKVTGIELVEGPHELILFIDGNTMNIDSMNFTFSNSQNVNAPGNLRGKALSSNQIKLGWTDNSTNESGFNIERSFDNNNFSIISKTAANVTSFIDESLESNTIYYYKINAFNSNGGVSNYSNYIIVKTFDTPPANPDNLHAVAISSSTIELNWDDNSDNEAEFFIERSIAGGTFSKIKSVSSNETKFIDTGLSSSTEYSYRLRAINPFGYSEYSNIINSKTLSEIVPINLPGSIEAEDYMEGGEGVAYHDTTPGNDGGAYRVDDVDIGIIDGSGFCLGYIDNGEWVKYNVNIEKTGTYDVSIRVAREWYDVNSNMHIEFNGENISGAIFIPNTGGFNNWKTVTADGLFLEEGNHEISLVMEGDSFNIDTLNFDFNDPGDNPTIAAPGLLTSYPVSPNQINLSWNDNSDNEEGFIIERSLDGNSFLQIASLDSNQTYYTNSNLNENTTYYYRVRAYNSTNYSEFSNITNSTTTSIVLDVSSSIKLNSLGFLPNYAKGATIASRCSNFNVRRVDNNSIVFTGKVIGPIYNSDTNEEVYKADFTSIKEIGTYYLDVPGVGRSYDFNIRNNIYNSPFYTITRAMYLWRCGCKVSGSHNGVNFQHGECHKKDGYLDYITGNHSLKEGGKGWHDAADFGKYVVNAGITLGLMFKAWEHNKEKLENLNLNIPESGGMYPDFLAEIKWELDWLLKMQYPDNSGRVSHKLTTRNFVGVRMPEDDYADRFYVDWSSEATANFVAIMAMAARIYEEYDIEFSQKCLDAARLSYNYLVHNPSNHYADQSAFKTGAYASGDYAARLWAAAEIWETTGDRKALEDFENRANGMSNKISKIFDWENPRNIGVITYLQSERVGKSSALESSIENDLLSIADQIVNDRNNHGYSRPLGTFYNWGCNGSVARQTLILLTANMISQNDEYINTSLDAIGYLFGRNYFSRSQVTGLGHNPPLKPHDSRSLADNITAPWPGYLVGGGWKNSPKGTSWADDPGDYEQNEVAINWNAALIYALSGFLD